MPTKKMKLAANDDRPVQVSWKGAFKNLKVAVDGNDVIELANRRELQAGQSATLPDGKTLSIGWAGSYSGGFFIELDGVPLPGSPSDPGTLVKVAAQVLTFVAVFNIALGLAAELGQVNFLIALGVGWASAVSGALYGGLAYGTFKRHFVALLLGVALFALDGLYTIYISYEYTQGTP
jgi:hypothetical protein